MKKLFTLVATRQDLVLKAYFVFVVILFLSILVAAYIIAKRANPILLDEKGKPINALIRVPGFQADCFLPTTLSS
ncbi:MAG TPA: hypothetical protein PKE58_22550 [Acidobacteriota bacterium]|nr:hypothetical protein [Acidobacteriota bacterium]